MQKKENHVYQKFFDEIHSPNLTNNKIVGLFLKIAPRYLDGQLSKEQFCKLADLLLNLKKELSGEINQSHPVIHWFMRLSASADWEDEVYNHRLRLFLASPENFEKWWRENIKRLEILPPRPVQNPHSEYKSNLYNKLYKKVTDKNQTPDDTVKLFLEIILHYLNNKLGADEFSGLSSELYFYQDNNLEVNKKYPIIFWLMSVAVETSWDGKYSKEKIQFYYQSPENFEKWWRENINSPVKLQSFSLEKGFTNRH